VGHRGQRLILRLFETETIEIVSRKGVDFVDPLTALVMWVKDVAIRNEGEGCYRMRSTGEGEAFSYHTVRPASCYGMLGCVDDTEHAEDADEMCELMAGMC